MASFVMAVLTFCGFTLSQVIPKNDIIFTVILVAAFMLLASTLTLFAVSLIAKRNHSRTILSVDTQIEFKIDSHNCSINSIVNSTSTPSGYLTRKTTFKTRRGFRDIRRYYIVTDYANVMGQDILQSCSHTAVLECHEKRSKKSTPLVRSLDISSKLADSRKLLLKMDAGDYSTLKKYKVFTLVETLRLPNDYDMLDEFYRMEVPEPAATWSMKLSFIDIEVDFVEHKVQRGSGNIDHQNIIDRQTLAGSNISTYTIKGSNLVPGEAHIFAWKYKNPKWKLRQIEGFSSPVL